MKVVTTATADGVMTGQKITKSGPCRDRTDDPQIKSLLLYRLS